jgi:predicted TPR repeat methyltransferase
MASLVVELLDGTRDLDQIRDILLPLVTTAGWDACRAWIDSAVRDGWLTTDCESSPRSPALTAGTLAALATSLRDRDEVIAAFICQQRAAELAPGDAQMWYRLGELAHIVGRRDDARAAYERYFEQRPDDAEVEHLLIALRNAAPPPRMPDHAVLHLYSRFAAFYDENMAGDLDYRAPLLLKRALVAAGADRRQLTILDLGCGTGLSGRALRPLARRLIGVDLSPAMIALARDRAVYDALHVAEITAFLQAEAVAGRQVDAISSCDALIYFGDLRQVIVPAARTLVRGGLLALTVERGDAYPWALADSGRFTHHRDHVVEAAGAAGLSVISLDDAVLRREYGNPVPGLVAVFGRGTA